MKKNLMMLLLIMLFILMLAFPQAVAEGAGIGLGRCLEQLVPSLFAIMAISNIVIKSGGIKFILKPLYPLGKILGLKGHMLFCFIVSNLAGYPMGGALLSEMVKNKQIDKKQAEIALCFCFCGGSAFFVGAIGLGVFENARAGLIIYLSCLATNIIFACILSRIFKISSGEDVSRSESFSSALINGVESAGRSMLTICFTVIFFSAVSRVVLSHIKPPIYQIASGILEISGVCELDISKLTTARAIQIISVLCSFGGVCVTLQILSLAKGNISLKYFLLSRPINMVINFFISGGLCKLMLPEALECSATPDVFVKNAQFFNPFSSVCLIFMIFSVIFSKKTLFLKKSML